MRALNFHQANVILAKDQPEYTPLPVHYDNSIPEKPMTCCFELTDEEVEEIVRTRKIWSMQLTFGQPFHPVSMSCSSPFPSE